MPGARTHPLPYAQNKKDARRLNTGTPKSHGTPCAMVYGCSVISPANQLFCHRLPGLLTPRVVPCIGGTGPHGLTVRITPHVLRRDRVHRNPPHVW